MPTIDVDDAESAEAQCRFAGGKVPVVIRTAMDEGGGHLSGDFRCPLTYSARDPAHQVRNLAAGGKYESQSRAPIGFPIIIQGRAEAIP
jgi:hypothetical protein